MAIMWDTRITQANIKHRLQHVGLPKAAIYAIGCVTHSRDAVLASQPQPLHPTFQMMSGLLEDFWRNYPNSLISSKIASSRLQASNMLPDEEQRVDYALAEDVLMDGIAYAFSLAAMNVYSEEAESLALSAIDRAYVFLSTFHHELDHIYESEEEIRAVESNSKYCASEIDFQLAFLLIIEAAQGLPPSYAEMIRESGN